MNEGFKSLTVDAKSSRRMALGAIDRSKRQIAMVLDGEEALNGGVIEGVVCSGENPMTGREERRIERFIVRGGHYGLTCEALDHDVPAHPLEMPSLRGALIGARQKVGDSPWRDIAQMPCLEAARFAFDSVFTG